MLPRLTEAQNDSAVSGLVAGTEIHECVRRGGDEHKNPSLYCHSGPLPLFLCPWLLRNHAHNTQGITAKQTLLLWHVLITDFITQAGKVSYAHIPWGATKHNDRSGHFVVTKAEELQRLKYCLEMAGPEQRTLNPDRAAMMPWEEEEHRNLLPFPCLFSSFPLP